MLVTDQPFIKDQGARKTGYPGARNDVGYPSRV